MILLDTHVLVWFLASPEKLSKRAEKKIESEIKNGEQILVSCISVWEIYLLVRKGRLNFSTDVDSWLEKVASLPFVQFIPVDNQISAKSVNLPGKFHDDPADRMIVATAILNGAELLTSDRKILAYAHVKSAW